MMMINVFFKANFSRVDNIGIEVYSRTDKSTLFP